MVIEMNKNLKANFDSIHGPFEISNGTPEKDSQTIINIGKTGLHAFDASEKIYKLIAEAKAEAEKNLKNSYVDSLTGCYNRNYFDNFKEHKFNPEYDNGVLGLIFIDLDNLKITNNTLGHNEGDNLLKDTASFLNLTFRRQDDIIRLGGDEFLVLCRNQNYNEDFESELLVKMEQARNKAPISYSYGVAIFDNDIDENLDDTTKRADILMYTDKEMKNRRAES